MLNNSSFVTRLSIAVFSLSLVGILWFPLSHLSFPADHANFLGKSGQAKLHSDGELTQTFVATEDHLNGIKILIKNFNFIPGERLIFSLRDDSCQETLTSSSVSFLNSKPLTYYRFTFSDIPDSKGKTYCLKTDFLSKRDRDKDNVLAIETSRDKAFAATSYIDNSKGRVYTSETLKIVPSYTKEGFLGPLTEMNQRLGTYKPFWLKGLIPLGSIALFLVSSFCLGLWIIMRKETLDS